MGAGGRQVPKSILYGSPSLILTTSKPENAFADVQRLSQFLTNINVALGAIQRKQGLSPPNQASAYTVPI